MSSARIRLRRRGGVAFWTAPSFERSGVRPALFLRTGGKSRGAFRGLNLGLNTADAPARVRANRRLALAAAGFERSRPVAPRQVHGTRLLRVTRRHAGRGWDAPTTAPRGIDGLLTDVPGLPLAVSVADCLPVLLAADDGRAVAAVHVGWRGLAAGILPKAVRAFWQHWHLGPERLRALVGPAIGPEAFEVRGEVLRRLSRLFPDAVRARRGDAAHFDLWCAARSHLRAAGLRPGRILVVRESTHAHPHRYFSHRRDHGTTGRMLGMIWREGKPAMFRRTVRTA